MNDITKLITIARAEVITTLRIWRQSVLPPVITMALYFIVFGTFIGSQIDDIDGYTYMQFIVPGLVMMSVINGSYMSVAFGVFMKKFQRALEEIIVAPVSIHTFILGFTISGVFRGLLIGLLVGLVSLLFTQLTIFSITYALSFIILTAFLFGLLGIIVALFSNKFDDVSIVPTFILTPLTYLGGVFYSISLLPNVWQIVSKFNPILYMVNGFRYGFLGITDIDVFIALGMLAVFVVIFYVICYVLLKKGIGLRT
jgi:ABC-2 type transport system permease protein